MRSLVALRFTLHFECDREKGQGFNEKSNSESLVLSNSDDSSSYGGDSNFRVCPQAALPNGQDAPSFSAQRLSHSPVTPSVPIELATPVVPMCAG